MKEKKEGVIRLEETSKAVMEEVLEYLYTGHVDINEHNAYNLIAAADFFLIPSLKELSANFILQTLSDSNCIFAYYSAINYQCEELLKGAKNFIHTNFETVTRSEDFLSLNIKQVEEWVSSDEIIIAGEEKVFEVIVRWFDANEKNKQEKFLNLFRHLRCFYVPRDYVFNVMLPHPLVKENLDCSSLVLDAMKLAFNGSEQCFFAQPPRNCLKTHEDAIVVIGRWKTLCYIPSQDGQKRWCELDDKYSNSVHSVSAFHGNLYVFGCDYAQLYDPTLHLWGAIKAPGKVTEKSAAVTLQGFLYVVGGSGRYGDGLSTVQKYNPDTNLWQEVSSLSYPRSSICAVADGSFLYAIGGINATDQYLDIVERFDPKTDIWDKLPSTLAARAGAGGAAIKQKVFVFGGLVSESAVGDSCEMFDPATNMWTGIPSAVSPRCHASAVSFKGKIYVFGGFQNERNRRVKSLRVYDIDNNKWESCTHVSLSLFDEEIKITCLRISKNTLAKCSTI
ncbi:hypothetical protein ACROYT_G000500 [Oculina patagonica]